MGRQQLEKALPETREKLQKLLAIRQGPQVLPPQELEPLSVAMTFFVSRRQKQTIEQALRLMQQALAGDDRNGKVRRGDLLAYLAEKQVSRASMDGHIAL